MQDLIALLSLFLFFILWMLIIGLIGRWGGWGSLAKKYRVERLPPGKRRTWQTGTLIRNGLPCNYGSCLTIVITEQGLGLHVSTLFRPGHPPLFIPWTEFYNPRRKTAFRFWRYIEAEIGDPALVTIRLPEWTLEQANEAMENPA